MRVSGGGKKKLVVDI